MKVTRNLPQQLIVEDRPWLISLMLVAFILIFAAASIGAFAEGQLLGGVLLGLGAGIGGVAMFLFSRRVQVVFDRPSDTITIKRRTMRGTTVVRHRLSNLGSTVLERSSGNSAHRGTAAAFSAPFGWSQTMPGWPRQRLTRTPPAPRRPSTPGVQNFRSLATRIATSQRVAPTGAFVV